VVDAPVIPKEESHMSRRAASTKATPGEFHSGLEAKVAEQILGKLGVEPDFESEVIRYIQPAIERSYLPDFRLPNGIYVETKGAFPVADRHRHLLIKEQHPDLDIRFVFTRSAEPLYDARSPMPTGAITTASNTLIGRSLRSGSDAQPEEATKAQPHRPPAPSVQTGGNPRSDQVLQERPRCPPAPTGRQRLKWGAPTHPTHDTPRLAPCSTVTVGAGNGILSEVFQSEDNTR
jgi:Phage endonuclease I